MEGLDNLRGLDPQIHPLKLLDQVQVICRNDEGEQRKGGHQLTGFFLVCVLKNQHGTVSCRTKKKMLQQAFLLPAVYHFPLVAENFLKIIRQIVGADGEEYANVLVHKDCINEKARTLYLSE